MAKLTLVDSFKYELYRLYGPTGLILFIFLITLNSCMNKQQKAELVPIEKTNAESSSTESMKSDKRIVIFGNSLTAGYGLEEGQSFPSLIQDRIDSLGLDYTVINAGLSGETTSGGANRIDWVLRQPVDIFILELGANDVLRGIDLENTEQNLRKILNKVSTKYPDAKIIIAGMLAPPNMGQAYTKRFNGIFPKLAEDYQAGLIPFLLENVATIAELNLPDGKHPNAQGQIIVMRNVWTVLSLYL